MLWNWHSIAHVENFISRRGKERTGIDLRAQLIYLLIIFIYSFTYLEEYSVNCAFYEEKN